VIDKDALREPEAVGRNVMLKVQLAPAARVEPQVVVRVKSPEFVPVIEVLLMVMLAPPLLVKVTVWLLLVVFTCWLPKAIEVGDKLATGAIPVPVKATVCGLPEALSVTDSDALREPVAVGLNVIENVQLAPTASVDPQVVVRVKSPEFVPEIDVLLIVILAVPVLVKVTVCAELVVLMS
jgi:hypothetical protein